MTWEELRDLLVELCEETRVVSTQGLETVALNLVPVAWFVSMRFHNALNIGVYQGDDNRLVGTEEIALPELTADFVRQRVEQALSEKVWGIFDPDILKRAVQQVERMSNPNVDRDLG